MRIAACFLCLLLVTIPGPAPAAGAEGDSGLLSALQAELDRSLAGLREAGPAPLYFLSYRVNDEDSLSLGASFGALTQDSRSRHRSLDVEARAGSYELDNTHQIRGTWDWGGGPTSATLPLEDDPAAIRVAAWRATDQVVKSAWERLAKVKMNRQVKVEEEDQSDDFSRAEPTVHIEEPVTLAVDAEGWRARLRRLSRRFKEKAFILSSSVSLTASATNRAYVSSEGTKLRFGWTRARLFVSAETKAEDGMDLSLYKSFEAPDAARLPAEEEVAAAIDVLIQRLDALRRAPLVEPYNGPAIIRNEACAVFFHEIFGHRVEGHRMKDVDEGQTFKKKVGKKITSPIIDVFDDPTLEDYRGTFLNGHYLFDDEGVKAERVPLIEAGILEGFLMCRSPIEGFPRSNGHGRCSEGYGVVARQGNLMVTARETVPYPKLREMLVEEVKKAGKDYGLVFYDISGGFTTTQRYGPQAFKVIPLYVVRVYADGREDEVVRGVDLVGTPLASIEKIVAAGDDPAVFNGVCGAESGWVPVSAAAPSVLVSEIEVEKKEKSQERLPFLPPPLSDPGERETPRKGGQ